MNLQINGEAKQIQLRTLLELVQLYQLEESLVVTEVDGVIINNEDRATFTLKEGMEIEIVQFVGGG